MLKFTTENNAGKIYIRKNFKKPLDKIKKLVYYGFVAVQDITPAYTAEFIESEADKVYKTYSLYSQSYIMESVCKTRFGTK